jgi:hypothetical protein
MVRSWRHPTAPAQDVMLSKASDIFRDAVAPYSSLCLVRGDGQAKLLLSTPANRLVLSDTQIETSMQPSITTLTPLLGLSGEIYNAGIIHGSAEIALP